MSTNPRLIDMTGYKVGRITVTGKSGNNLRGAALWVCACECGNKSINTGSDIRKGKVSSCGCLSKDRIAWLNKSHSSSKTRLYTTWQNMKARCFNKNSSRFKNYGGRGITICQDWLDFVNFQKWALSNGYAENLTIERVDVNDNYCPENCTWIEPKYQSANRNYTIKNELGILWLHIAQQNGISKSAFRCRVFNGWSLEEASSLPLRKRREEYSYNRSSTGQFC